MHSHTAQAGVWDGWDSESRVAGKSSLLNLPKAPLKLGGAVVAVMGDKLTDVTTGAASLLRRELFQVAFTSSNVLACQHLAATG